MNWGGKKIYFIGIKGTGISGLAILLKKEGAFVSGSDTAEEFPSELALRKENIEIRNFDEDNITPELDLIIYSSAYDENHPERKRARQLEIAELSYAAALARYAENTKVIMVTGTHGKTTTTALLGQIFEAAGLDPKVLAGDIVKSWGSSARWGRGEYFILEGDEYQEKFRLFKPVGILIPSLDYDHPDYFPSREAYLESFESWLKENSGAKVVLSSEKEDDEIFRKAKFILPGGHYRRNCLLAIRLSRLFAIPDEAIIRGINNFQGVKRRLEYYADWIVYDYAHHPEEIKATLEALKEKFPSRAIIAVFQPHTFSRTEAFLEDFAKSFGLAEEVFFEEIYSSAREKKGKVSLADLILETKKYHPRVYHFRDFDFKKFNSKKDILIFMGAGDIWQKARELGELLSGKKGGAD